MIVDCDLAQLEWRIACFLSQDKVGIQEIIDDVDFHLDNAEHYLVPHLGEDGQYWRTPAKSIGFGLVYGKTPGGFAKDVNFPINNMAACKEMVEGWYNKYYGIKQWHRKLEVEVRNHGELTLPSGRILQFVRHRRRDGSLDYSVPQIKNYPVQSFATADVAPLATVHIARKLKALGSKARINLLVHDSIISDCPKEEVNTFVGVCVGTFRELPKIIERRWGISFNVPLDGDAKAGSTWFTAKKISLEQTNECVENVRKRLDSLDYSMI